MGEIFITTDVLLTSIELTPDSWEYVRGLRGIEVKRLAAIVRAADEVYDLLNYIERQKGFESSAAQNYRKARDGE